MSTQTAESNIFISSLSGISDAPFFRDVVPVTNEEERLVRQKIKDFKGPNSKNKGVFVGDLLLYEKALLIRSLMISMDIEKMHEELGNTLELFLGTTMSGSKEDEDAMHRLRLMTCKSKQLQELFWFFVDERFSEVLSREKVIGLHIDHNFQVFTMIGDGLELCRGVADIINK